MSDQEAAERYIAALDRERAAFVELHRDTAAAHPEWIRRNDARTNLLAKPINLIRTAVVSMRLLQDHAGYVEFWRRRIDPSLATLEAVFLPYFEWNTFNRFGFFQFLLSNIEHGFRAIHAHVVAGVGGYTDQDFARVYPSLFATVLSPDRSALHTPLFDFLRLLRNTIHNNAVFYPRDRRDATFTVAGRDYTLTVGRRIEYFGWEYFIEWLGPIREALQDVLSAPAVVAVDHVSDIASHP